MRFTSSASAPRSSAHRTSCTSVSDRQVSFYRGIRPWFAGLVQTCKVSDKDEIRHRQAIPFEKGPSSAFRIDLIVVSNELATNPSQFTCVGRHPGLQKSLRTPMESCHRRYLLRCFCLLHLRWISMNSCEACKVSSLYVFVDPRVLLASEGQLEALLPAVLPPPSC